MVGSFLSQRQRFQLSAHATEAEEGEESDEKKLSAKKLSAGKEWLEETYPEFIEKPTHMQISPSCQDLLME